jgi:sugar O-acyltransferase (sialic acid O-acetyltransferase NeuD family)
MAAATTAPQGSRPDGRLTLPRLIIVGGGEHARVVAEAAAAAGLVVAGHTNREGSPLVPPSGSSGDGLEPLGTDEEIAASLAAMQPTERPWLVLGFGGPPDARRRATAAFGGEARWATITHPAAWVSPSATLGQGTVVLAGAVVNAGAAIGDHAIVNSRAVIEHDVRLGSHVHVGPGATIGGGTRIGDDAIVGLGAAVRDHLTLGSRAIVGMGAVVVADVPEGSVVTGNPARPRPSPRVGDLVEGASSD